MNDGSLWGDYIKTILLLAGIVLLAWAALRYWLPRTAGFRQMTAGPVRVVARYALEPRKTLYVVTVGSEHLLLGAAENSIQLLSRLDPAGLESWLSAPPPEPRLDFKSVLKGLRK